MNFRLIVLLFACFIVVTGCTNSELQLKLIAEPNRETESSYVDYINIGDKHYINAWELALNDTVGIKEIGVVNSGLYIPEGTPVYSLPDYPENEVVVVKADSKGLVTNISGYLVYVLHGEDGKPHYPNIKNQQVKQIKIYKDKELVRELSGEDVNSFLHLFKQQGPHNEFQFEKAPEYTVLFIGDHVLGLNYGVMEKDGYFGLAHTESKLPDEIAIFFE